MIPQVALQHEVGVDDFVSFLFTSTYWRRKLRLAASVFARWSGQLHGIDVCVADVLGLAHCLTCPSCQILDHRHVLHKPTMFMIITIWQLFQNYYKSSILYNTSKTTLSGFYWSIWTRPLNKCLWDFHPQFLTLDHCYPFTTCSSCTLIPPDYYCTSADHSVVTTSAILARYHDGITANYSLRQVHYARHRQFRAVLHLVIHITYSSIPRSILVPVIVLFTVVYLS